MKRVNVQFDNDVYLWLKSKGNPSKVIRDFVTKEMDGNVTNRDNEVVTKPNVTKCDIGFVTNRDIVNVTKCDTKVVTNPVVSSRSQVVSSKSSMDVVDAKGDWGRQRMSKVTRLSFDDWYKANSWRYE